MTFVEETQVVILAGGLGKRLRPYTETIPKPLIEISEKPFLEYKLNQLRNFGTKKILLCVGYLGEKIEEYFKDGKDFGLDIKYSYEKELLGTAGAIKLAESLIETNPFIVMNGDTYLNFDIAKLNEDESSKIIMVVANATNPLEQELVEIERDTITNFHQRGTLNHQACLKNPSTLLINGGVYRFRKEIFQSIPEGRVCSLEKEIFPRFLGEIKGIRYRGYVKDLANIQFCKELEDDLISGAGYDS